MAVTASVSFAALYHVPVEDEEKDNNANEVCQRKHYVLNEYAYQRTQDAGYGDHDDHDNGD
jgi:hypothetical protein